MSIRLSKACKDLNVGMTTAVEFLAKKGHKIVVDPNLKLSDDLHLLLAKEFNKDMALKIESERLSQERQLKEKAATVSIEGYNQPKPAEKSAEAIHISIPEEQLPHFKSVGHIDLSAKGKHSETKPEVTEQTPVAANPIVVEKPVVVVVEEKPVEKTEVIKPEEIKEVKEIKTIEVPVVEKAEEIVTPPVAKAEPEVAVETKEAPVVTQIEEKEEPKVFIKEEIATSKPKIEPIKPVKKFKLKEEAEPAEVNTPIKDSVVEDEIFSLSRPTIDVAPVVIGTIDLDLLNQSTRPKPKTKEQKRKEREDKNKVDVKKTFVGGEKKILRTAAEVAADPASAHPKKKRERFSNQKVDITKVPQANGATQGFAHPKKVTPGTTGGGGGAAKPTPNKDRLKKSIKTVVN